MERGLAPLCTMVQREGLVDPAALTAQDLYVKSALENAIPYSFSSESLDYNDVDIEDFTMKAHFHFRFGAKRGAPLLSRRSDEQALSS